METFHQHMFAPVSKCFDKTFPEYFENISRQHVFETIGLHLEHNAKIFLKRFYNIWLETFHQNMCATISKCFEKILLEYFENITMQCI